MDVLDVLDLGDGPVNAEFLRHHAGQHIGLVVAGQGQKCVVVLDPFLQKQVGVPAVTDDDDHIVRQPFRQNHSTLLVPLQNLHGTDFLAEPCGDQLGDVRSAEDHHLVDLYVALAEELHQKCHTFAGGYDEDQVIEHKLGVVLRHNGLATA